MWIFRLLSVRMSFTPFVLLLDKNCSPHVYPHRNSSNVCIIKFSKPFFLLCMISEPLLMPLLTTQILAGEGPKRVQWWRMERKLSNIPRFFFFFFFKRVFPLFTSLLLLPLPITPTSFHFLSSCPVQSPIQLNLQSDFFEKNTQQVEFECSRLAHTF